MKVTNKGKSEYFRWGHGVAALSFELENFYILIGVDPLLDYAIFQHLLVCVTQERKAGIFWTLIKDSLLGSNVPSWMKLMMDCV